MKVGSRVVVYGLHGREAYRGKVVAVSESRITVQDDELGEDHEVIRSLVKAEKKK